MNRRQFLKTASLATTLAALAACDSAQRLISAPVSTAFPSAVTPVATPLPLTPLPEDEKLRLHTLRRITFGPTPAEAARARQIGLEAFVQEQLNPEKIPDDTGARLAPFTTLTMTPLERFQLEQRQKPMVELVLATLTRQVYSPRQLHETLVDFWTNHFNIFIGKDQARELKTDDDRDVIRAHALGRFQALLSASAHSPAMLVYLDNARSTNQIPNENYARELMELHTLGVDGGYTQLDVMAAARALTGWSVAGKNDPDAGSFRYRPRLHDDAEKFILGRKFPAEQGQADGDQLIALLAAHPSTARHVAFKLARRFVADQPPDSLVTALADTFQSTGGDIRAVMQTLLHSREFQASAGQKLKRPLEFFVSALRVTEAQVNQPRPLLEQLRALGQVPFFWQTPDGYPDYADPWKNTGGLLNRWNFALHLTANQIPGTRVEVRSWIGDASDPESALEALSRRFFGGPLPDDARRILAAFAGQGQWPDNLPAVAGLMLGSPYFQVR